MISTITRRNSDPAKSTPPQEEKEYKVSNTVMCITQKIYDKQTKRTMDVYGLDEPKYRNYTIVRTNPEYRSYSR